jgi:hypothetical protein
MASMILTQVDYNDATITVFMSTSSFGALCLAFGSDYGTVSSEPFTVSIVQEESEEGEEAEPSCAFYMLPVADITLSVQQIMQMDIDVEGMIGGDPECVYNVTEVEAQCYDEFVGSSIYNDSNPDATEIAVLMAMPYMGAEVSIFMSTIEQEHLCFCFDSPYGVICSNPFGLTITYVLYGGEDYPEEEGETEPHEWVYPTTVNSDTGFHCDN